MGKIKKSEKEWREQLGDKAYHITREQGTEPPFSGTYCNEKAQGMYHCLCCDTALFPSKTKYNSGTGWPSFYDTATKQSITEKPDTTHNMTRTEVLCKTCDAHLGHLFPDGPHPTGKRYCINSTALTLKKTK